jgi:hypothetical protein
MLRPPDNQNLKGEKMEDDQKKLLEATRRLLDLKMEKKKYLSEINDQIHETETEIKELALDYK